MMPFLFRDLNIFDAQAVGFGHRVALSVLPKTMVMGVEHTIELQKREASGGGGAGGGGDWFAFTVACASYVKWHVCASYAKDIFCGRRVNMCAILFFWWSFSLEEVNASRPHKICFLLSELKGPPNEQTRGGG